MTDGFPGDPGHEGGSQPMRSLKGGCSGVNVQAPMSGENSGASQGPPDGTSGNIAGWDGFLADSGGSRGVSGNDSRTKST
jgi:hypothetical protein